MSLRIIFSLSIFSSLLLGAFLLYPTKNQIDPFIEVFTAGKLEKAEAQAKKEGVPLAEKKIFLAYIARAKGDLEKSDQYFKGAALWTDLNEHCREIALNLAFNTWLRGDIIPVEELQEGFYKSYFSLANAINKKKFDQALLIYESLQNQTHEFPLFSFVFQKEFPEERHVLLKAKLLLEEKKWVEARQYLKTLPPTDQIRYLLGISYFLQGRQVPLEGRTIWYKIAFENFDRIVNPNFEALSQISDRIWKEFCFERQLYQSLCQKAGEDKNLHNTAKVGKILNHFPLAEHDLAHNMEVDLIQESLRNLQVKQFLLPQLSLEQTSEVLIEDEHFAAFEKLIAQNVVSLAHKAGAARLCQKVRRFDLAQSFWEEIKAARGLQENEKQEYAACLYHTGEFSQAKNFADAYSLQVAYLPPDSLDLGHELKRVNQWISRYPNVFHGYLARGKIYAGYGNVKGAKDEFLKALKLDCSCVEAYLELAALPIEEQQREAYLKRGVAFDPDCCQAWGELARLYERQNNIMAAMEAGQKSLLLEPRSAIRWAQMGRLHLEAMNFEKAAVCLQKALELEPENLFAKRLNKKINSYKNQSL